MTTLYQRFLNKEIPPTHTHYNLFVELKSVNRLFTDCNYDSRYEYEKGFKLWLVEGDNQKKISFKSLREVESYLMGVNQTLSLIYSQNLLNALGV